MSNFVSHIACGVKLVGMTPAGSVHIVMKVAAGAWAVFEISAGDLLLLQGAETLPRLESARCVVLGRSQTDCLEQRTELERYKALEDLGRVETSEQEVDR